MRQRQDLHQQQQLKMGLGTFLAPGAIFMALFHLAFIISDLIFANQDTDCVRTPVSGFSFTLQTWLLVDAYTRIGILVFLLIFAIATCSSLTCGAILIGFYSCIFILYAFFSVAWFIIGAIMFWGHLNSTGKCTEEVQIYMHIMLISSIVLACINCFFGGSQNSSLNATTITQPHSLNVPQNGNPVYKI